MCLRIVLAFSLGVAAFLGAAATVGGARPEVHAVALEAAPLPGGETTESLLLAGGETVAVPQREFRVKAAFLVNFVRFTDWPPEALGPPGAPIVIGILGLNPFGDDLVNAVRDRTLHDRPVRVITIATREDFDSCHVIYVTPDDHLRWDPLLLALRDRPVLTVGDEPNFARDLGLIGFFLEGERVRFEINLQSVERAGLRMSSRMLTLARIVGRRSPLRRTGRVARRRGRTTKRPALAESAGRIGKAGSTVAAVWGISAARGEPSSRATPFRSASSRGRWG